MFRLKKYDRKAYSARFRKFKWIFLISFFVFVLSAALEMLLFGADKAALNGRVELLPFFRSLFTGEAVLFTLTFLLGITVYAPVFQFLLALYRGFAAGYTLFSLSQVLGEEGSVAALLLCGLYLLFSAWLFFAYSSFCTLVSMRLFTDGIKWNLRAEEERVFGGTLFNSTLFCNTVNLRFLFSYSLFFILGVGFVAAFDLAYAFLFSRLL